MEIMDEYRMNRRVLMADVSGGRARGRPRVGWMDGMKVPYGQHSADSGVCAIMRER